MSLHNLSCTIVLDSF